MAEPVSFSEANLTIAGPGAAPDEMISCSLQGDGRDGWIVTCWRPSFLELAEILRTGVIWLGRRGGDPAGDVVVTGHKAEVLGSQG